MKMRDMTAREGGAIARVQRAPRFVAVNWFLTVPSPGLLGSRRGATRSRSPGPAHKGHRAQSGGPRVEPRPIPGADGPKERHLDREVQGSDGGRRDVD